MAQVVAGALCAMALAMLTVVVFLTVRERHGPTARHYASLALPFGLVPAVAALAVAGPRAAIGTAVLVVGLQVVTGVVESHVAGRVALLRGGVESEDARRRGERER